MSEQIFSGIRVLDFTQFLAGPYCSMYLSDMGAEVIKVENLNGGGDFVRGARPRHKDSGLSMYFQNLNRGKKSVSLNLKSEDGKRVFARLVRSADVLVENNRPGVMDRLGFGYEECARLNPGLIYASVSGFGHSGPYRDRPGYDLIAQAMAGSMSITGWPGSDPTRAGMAIGDLMGGMNACIAVCASLYKRRETGLGQHIDISLVDSLVSGLEAKMMEYIYTGRAPEKSGNRYITSAPYDSFRARDTYFVMASGTDVHFSRLSAMMGMPKLPEDPRFCDTPTRQKNHGPLKEIIERWAADKTAEECVRLILNAGVPAGPINDIGQVYRDPNTRERGMVVKVSHPEAGDLEVLGNPLKMSRYPCRYEKAAPGLGADNDEILLGLGFTGKELDAFRKNGAVG